MVDHTVDELLAAVTAADAGADSLIAYNATLKQQVIDAVGNAMTPDMRAKINTAFDVSTAEATKIAAAIPAPADTTGGTGDTTGGTGDTTGGTGDTTGGVVGRGRR